jgi:hypothetical protein
VSFMLSINARVLEVSLGPLGIDFLVKSSRCMTIFFVSLVCDICHLPFNLFLLNFDPLISIVVHSNHWNKNNTNIGSSGGNIPLWSTNNHRPSGFSCWVMESTSKQVILCALEKLIREVKQNWSTT